VTRVYTLQDVLGQLNNDSSAYIDTNPNEPVNQFMAGNERLKFNRTESFTDWTPYPWLVVHNDTPTGIWLLSDPVAPATAFDSCATQKHMATVTGTVTFQQTGPYAGAKAALFDGSTGFADAGGAAALWDPSGTKSFSIEAWIKPSTVDTTFRRACGNEHAGNKGAFLLWQSANGWGLVRGDSSGVTDAAYGGAPSAGTWAYVAGTYDGTNIRTYVNGSLVATQASSRSVDTAGGTFRMGGTAGGGLFASAQYGVAVWNTVLTATQIANHYAWGTAANATNAYTYNYGSPVKYGWFVYP
jgi:Concanavalin A-like lectin/glucanases superfamily